MMTLDRPRLDLAANFTIANPVLAAGEMAIEIDTGLIKIGDGFSAYGDISYLAIGGGAGGAPTTATYLVRTADGGLSAERVLTNTESIVADWATAGQVKLNVQFGSTATTACAGNDARLSDARAPTAHKLSHQAGGVDELAIAESQVTGLTAALAAKAPLASPSFSGTVTLPVTTAAGNPVSEHRAKVMTGVSGALTSAAHAGNILKTSGNVVVPNGAGDVGFGAVVVAGGAHTVGFNGAASPAMAAGDVMTVFVESTTVIHAVLTAAADKVSFA